jgi:hypothetical protein
MKVNIVPFRPRPSFGQLFWQTANFLEHPNIRINGIKIAVDALSDGGSDAVDVP